MTNFTGYFDANGQPHWRPRPRRLRSDVPDIDSMSIDQLRKFMASRHHGTATMHGRTKLGFAYDKWARKLWPDRPIGHLAAASILYRMAWLRLHAIQLSPIGGRAEARARLAMVDYEQLYETLPEWARWRQGFSITGAAVPGKQFRPVPARKRSKPISQAWDKKPNQTNRRK